MTDTTTTLDEALAAERARIRASLIPAALAALRCIPDGQIQSGCVIHDGAQVRAKLKAAVNGIVDQPDAVPAAPEAMWGDRMPPLSLLEVEPWLRTCGHCDAGLPHPCTCPEADPRPIINRLAWEVEKLRAELKQGRNDAWGQVA